MDEDGRRQHFHGTSRANAIQIIEGGAITTGNCSLVFCEAERFALRFPNDDPVVMEMWLFHDDFYDGQRENFWMKPGLRIDAACKPKIHELSARSEFCPPHD